MEKDNFKNRKVDKLPLEKSKKYMWRYIQSKTAGSKVTAQSSFGNFFKSLFIVPARLASVSVVAVVLIVAIVFGDSLRGFLPGLIEVPTVHANFEMSADSEDSAGVDSDSGFTLKSSEDYSEDVIAANLKIEPAVEVEIDKIGEGEYKITPEELSANKVYNFWIESEDKRYSWAYQIKDTFKVMGTLPANQATYVPVDSGIEFYFSHEGYDIDDFEKHFAISPEAKGSFEKHNRTAVFVPKGGLKEGTIYTVTLKKGFKLADSDQKLKEDFSFQFETNMEAANYTNFEFMKDYYEIASNNGVGLRAYYYDYQNAEKNLTVDVYRYPDLNAYLAALEDSFEIPNWCYFTRRFYDFDTKGLENLGSFEALIETVNWSSYIYLPDATFEPGYYLIKTGFGGGDEALLQVTDLSSYINVSSTETLIWVNDIATGEAVGNAKIEISGSDKQYTAGKDGVVTFETPEEWKQGWQERGSYYVKITAPDKKVLINQITPSDDSYLRSQYWYTFNTDRPMYQPTDTVKFFGFIEPKTGNVGTDNLNLRLDYSWQTYVKEMPITLTKDGTFSGEMELENFTPGYYSLTMFNGDEIIATHSIQVADYVKPAYNLSVDVDKNAVFAGEKMNFTISSEFFDGTSVPNLEFQYYDGYDYKTVNTDKDGKYLVDLTAEKATCSDDYCYDQHYLYFNASPTLAEESNIYASAEVQIFDSRLNIDGFGEADEGIAKIDIKTNWIDLSRLNAETNEFYNDYLGKVAQGREITGEITEIYWEEIEDGEYYDFINKKVVKKYRYEKHENFYDSFEVTTDGKGEANYEFKMHPERYYRVRLEGLDDNGNAAHQTVYVYGSARTSDYDYYYIKFLNGETEEESGNFWHLNYGFDLDQFDIGETVEVAVVNNDSVLAKDTEGEFMFMQHSNGLQEYAIEDSPYYSFEFEKADVPNVFVSGVWFNGQSYKTVGSSSANYEKDLERLDIEISTDEEKYEPGDSVNLSVKVTDKDGKPAQAKVNLSLVDEAYYKIVYDNFVDPLDDLYASNDMGVLTTYETHDNPVSASEAEGGLGGCFTGETQILMADGSYKAIKDIRKGDIILTKDHELSGVLVAAEVKNTVSHFVSEYLVINEELEVTGVHVVFVNGKWDTADNVRVGDKMLGKDGELIEVASIRKVSKPVWVYNFEVDQKHTYFANGYYVHNDKGGDGIRNDFEDTAVFEVISIDASGKGNVEFQLPDNITSWRVIAKAIDTENLRAGATVENVTVSLPFFTDLIMNREYSVKDKPILKFRSFGDELSKGDEVEYVLSAESLGMTASDEISGEAFGGSYGKLPELKIGSHEVTLFAESGKYEDALRETTTVKGSRLKQNILELIRQVDNKTAFELSGDGPTEIAFVDGGVGFYYGNLMSLYYSGGDRLDQKLSGLIAAELLTKYFTENRPYDSENLISGYQSTGLNLLPYSDPDLRLTALALYVDPNRERYDGLKMSEYLYEIYKNKDSNLEEVVLSLLGLASMDEPVLLSLREIQDAEELELAEKLYIALAFEALGSDSEAEAIYKDIFDQLAEDNVYETALGAILAAGIEDDQAATLLWEFVELNKFEDDIRNLYEIGYVKNSLEHVDSEPVVFKVQIGDHIESVELEKWQSFKLMAFPGDEVAVSVIEGQLAANMYYPKSVTPEEFEADERVKIDRSYFVNGKATDSFNEGDLVEVVLDVSFDGQLEHPYFKITDILPSGLKLATNLRGSGYYYYYDDAYFYPYRTNGQEVYFYWYENAYEKADTITYYARVVNPGEFYADPARIESYYDPAIANISDSNTVTILK